MNVRQLTKWLECQDQDAIVEVLQIKSTDNYPHKDYGERVLFDPAQHAAHYDLRRHPHCVNTKAAKTNILLLGGQ